jgi:hypothetical protein
MTESMELDIRRDELCKVEIALRLSPYPEDTADLVRAYLEDRVEFNCYKMALR